MVDLYCCQGGASMGYHRAGFDIVGVDINPQPRYPFKFIQADALAFLMEYGHEFAGAHASPPCQARTPAQKIQGNTHPNLIAPTRGLLKSLRIPYVIENVVPENAALDPDPLVDPVTLCGAMFGLRTYRHRQFESNFPIDVPEHPEHRARTTKMGRPPVDGEFMHVVGNFSGVDEAKAAMGIDWMTRDGLRESIPPAYTEHIGRQLIAQLGEVAA
jgi:DNA (cytosine-5)-methyltransferase 1